MNLKTRMSRLWNYFEDLFFKNHACLACRKEISDDTQFCLCEKCFGALEVFKGTICEKCGDVVLADNNFCDRCKTTKFEFDKNRSFAVYEDVAAKMVKRFKYSGKKYYAKYLAELMFANREYFEDVDIITFVPIGKRRRAERGFNQAEELAKELGLLTNIEVIDTLNKLGNEKHQAGLSQKERQENLSGSFKLKDEALTSIRNKNILLIDDVFTTGATLSECARVLKSDKKNKPSKIYCYTFAKTRLNSTNNGQIQQNNHVEIKTR